MVQIRLSLLAVTVTVLAVLESTTANPFRYLGYRPSSPVRLTVHAPVSGADVAFSRAESLHPFLNPGIVPGDYFLMDEFGNPNAKNNVLIVNNPDVDIGGKYGPGLY